MFKQSLCHLLTVCCISALSANAMADNEKGSAVIKGRVTYIGTPPGAKPLPNMNANPVCNKANPEPTPDQDSIVYIKERNAIPYVFVYIKTGLKGKYDSPSEPIIIDQRGCPYHPHVQGMVVGQQINIKNGDPTNHNIHSLAKKNPQFNFAQPNKDMVKELKRGDTFNKPEIMVKLTCDVHAWMSTYVGVCSHPFFDVTKSHTGSGGDATDAGDKSKRGTFEIKNLPAGEYEIEAWHARFGTATQRVTVKEGETKEIEFKMGK